MLIMELRRPESHTWKRAEGKNSGCCIHEKKASGSWRSLKAEKGFLDAMGNEISLKDRQNWIGINRKGEEHMQRQALFTLESTWRTFESSYYDQG